MKLSKTTAQNSFKYSWLLARIYPYIKSGRHFDAGMCRIRRVKNK